MTSKKLQTTNFIFLVILIIFLPFQGLLGAFLENRISTSVIFWLLHWYELILLILLVLTFFQNRLNHKKNNLIEIIICALVCISLVSSLFFEPLTRAIEGFRFLLSGFLVFLLAYWSDFNLQRKLAIEKFYITISILITTWAVIEKIFLPSQYWGEWGIIPKDMIWGYGWHMVGKSNQVASIIGGPNQLASYLLPAFFLLVFWVLEKNENKKNIFNKEFLFLLLIGVVIFLTYSRSSVIGLVFSLVLMPFLTKRYQRLKIPLVAFGITCLIIVAYLKIIDSPFITHGLSQSGHYEAMRQAFIEIKNRFLHHFLEFLFGGGMGTAGPLVLKYKIGLIPESWYLQLFLEIGLVGFSLWLLFVGLVSFNLFKHKKYYLLLGLIAVLITSLFLHTWADNPALVYMLFTLLGLNLEKSKIGG